jgi:hypothetical protein
MADLSIPDLSPDVDMLGAALAYAAAGWYVLPIDPAGKHAGSVLGKRWPDKTSRDPDVIASWFAGTNYGVALHVGRSGAVVFDVDRPDRMPPELRQAIDEHAPPHQATRTNDPGRGHYVFAAEAGRFGNSRGDLGAEWGEVRGLNGIIVAEPTTHEKAEQGGQYAWGTGRVPPALPATLSTKLRPPSGAATIVDEHAALAWLDELPAGAPGAAVLSVDVAMPASGRHDAMTKAAMRLVRLGEQKHPGVRDRLVALGQAFVAAVTPDRRGGAPEAREEFRRAVAGAVAIAKAEPTPDLSDWLDASVTPPGQPAPAGDDQTDAIEVEPTRIVDLGPWLDGSWQSPEPAAGVIRDDDRRLMYPGRWHNVDAPNESGKTWLGLAHARDEMLNAERAVAYIHFEEELPGGTIARLLALGLDRELIRARFVWLSNDRPWQSGDLAAALARVPNLGLLILDGRNAACTRHGQDPSDPKTVGWFRGAFVAPAARLGAAVFSMGHPVKAKDRQDERHGFGSTAWLDELDGVGFRLTPSKDHPIRRGAFGSASLHVVKDRYGEVSKLCTPDAREGWRYAGSLVVDDSGLDGHTSIRLSVPSRDMGEAAPNEIDRLADAVAAALADVEGQRYESERELGVKLRAAGVTHAKEDLPVALERLERSGRLGRGAYAARKPRPGWLASDPSILMEES